MLFRSSGITPFGVTKGTCGMPQVARAMLRGGVAGIAESRFENIRRLRDSGISAPVMLLRSPPISLNFRPKATRLSARLHIASNARSATPINRMQ